MTTLILKEKTDKLFETGFVSFYNLTFAPTTSTENVLASFLDTNNYPIIEPESLGRPFNLDKLKPTDFKILSKNELTSFLKDFADPKGWTNKDEIVRQVKYISNVFNQLDTEFFHIISPSFFEMHDPRIDIIGHVYVYYYIILAITADNKITVCNMVMD